MANAKISALPAVTSAAGGDLAVVVASGVTSQITVDELFENRTLVAPALGTPASGNLSSCTDLPIVAGTTGTLSVARGGTGITAFGTGVATALGQNVTGSGGIALATSPSFTTPTLGVASATSVNKVAITAPATSATLTIADGKTLTASNTLTFTGTDSSSVAFGSGGTVQYFLTDTQVNFEDIANAINTTGKFAGKQVWSTTDSQPVWAAGAAAGDVWVDGTGATVYTPV